MNKKSILALTMAFVMTCSLCGCSGNSGSTQSGPVQITAGDNNSDNTNSMVENNNETSTNKDTTSENNGESDVSSSEETSVVQFDGIEEKENSVMGSWSDMNGNSFSFYSEDNTDKVTIAFINDDTCYEGIFKTDNKTYITVDVKSGYEKGKEFKLEEPSFESGEITFDNEEDALKYEQEMQKKIEEFEKERENHVFKTIKIAIKSFKIVDDTLTLTLEINGKLFETSPSV